MKLLCQTISKCWRNENKLSIPCIMSLLSNDNSILHKSFDDKNMRNTRQRHNKIFKSGCQQMLKKEWLPADVEERIIINMHAMDFFFFHFYIKAIAAWRKTWRITTRLAMSSLIIIYQHQQQRKRNDTHFQRLNNRYATITLTL